MATITTAIVDVSLVGHLYKAGVRGFRCRECGEELEYHSAGGGHAEHMEHVKLNLKCSLSSNGEHRLGRALE